MIGMTVVLPLDGASPPFPVNKFTDKAVLTPPTSSRGLIILNVKPIKTLINKTKIRKTITEEFSRMGW